MLATTIDARPTKKLFIAMLIKDITLNDAIGDLIDNCVDGALKLRSDRDYSGLNIRIIANSDQFVIEDNCSGIDEDTAINYAFRFGRTDNTPSLPKSVGQFGIGMKRALFKLGNKFTIESTSEKFRFQLVVNVTDWKTKEDEWSFTFDTIERPNGNDVYPTEQRGTKIVVTDLHEDVKKKFGLENFINDLSGEIRLEHLANIERGIKIEINNQEITSLEPLLIKSNDIKPAYWEKSFEIGLGVKIVVGISERNLNYGGWYIFCNERMTLGPEQTSKTGWGVKKPISIPKYHNQFDRFRGFVYFDSEDTSLLPWNSSKNDIDKDSPLYLSIKQQMVIMMRPVIDFLNKVHDESNPKYEEKPLREKLQEGDASTIALNKIFENHSDLISDFIYPDIENKSIDNLIEVSYYQPKHKVEKAMQETGIETISELGSASFDYFYSKEIGD
ncbi:hypothetical protein SDC9_68712 [bioreactor metagenome]|uniref:Histidine kinase/HSP90-like ATPase domain-containing protein n=1 Tax=bioreactor metagenome TaxID=1076179 RepID=A0A644Y2V7_9ZZZZ